MEKGCVVITGASSGIGRACALYLDEMGFQVFAGVRRDVDAQALRGQASERLRPVLLDVTAAGSIASAVERVSAVAGGGLAGLVNNAGIAVAGPLESITSDELRRQFEVNVIGQIAVTQAFLPLLRRGRGRIINMGSISGRLTTPFTGPYCSSKAALEALTTALRMELKPWGVAVSIVEPGVVDTPILEKSVSAVEQRLQALPPQARRLYAPTIAALRRHVGKLGQAATAPRVVARAVAHALTARRPRFRYVVGWDARLVELARSLPERLREGLILQQMGLSGVEIGPS
jgi:NAD(P)-dependent dehydrogenase (short-subunit alcohol dehydrogenase family)